MSEERPRILVVEDDLNVVHGLIAGLKRGGFDLSVAMDGHEGARMALDEDLDLVVLDLMLPGQSGFDILQAMSGRVSTPVIVLSARTELSARLESFRLGAIDYVAKPFFIEELIARIQARLALRAEAPHRIVSIGSVRVDLDARTVTREGEDLGLTAREFNILAWLADRSGRAVTRAQLAEHALDAEGVSDRTVDSHVSRVRKKLGEDGVRIKTVWGVGYRVDVEAS